MRGHARARKYLVLVTDATTQSREHGGRGMGEKDNVACTSMTHLVNASLLKREGAAEMVKGSPAA